jgi:hypothetical protein
LTPSSTALPSPEAVIGGVTESAQSEQGQALVVKVQVWSVARWLPARSAMPLAPPLIVAV